MLWPPAMNERRTTRPVAVSMRERERERVCVIFVRHFLRAEQKRKTYDAPDVSEHTTELR